MHVRTLCFGQEKWYHNVTRAWCSDGCIHLALSEHPSLVHHWLGSTAILMAATPEDVTALLREERRPRSTYADPMINTVEDLRHEKLLRDRDRAGEL